MHLAANVGGAILILGLGLFGFYSSGVSPKLPTDTSRQDAPVLLHWWKSQKSRHGISRSIWTLTAKRRHIESSPSAQRSPDALLDKPETTRSGTFVHKGDLLFEIDPVNYQLEEQRLKARVEQAREEFKAVDVDIQNATTLLKLAEEENQAAAESSGTCSLFVRAKGNFRKRSGHGKAGGTDVPQRDADSAESAERSAANEENERCQFETGGGRTGTYDG